MAILGLLVPESLGVGYDYVDRVLGGDFPLKMVVLLAVLKIISTPVCYSSGNAGGIFGPSLFIGAMIGGAVGSVAHQLFPATTANPGAYALVGMGTAFAGIVRTPLTSVIMIFEMTRDYSIIVPLMISNLISFFISQQLQHEPIYEALALQEGVYLPGGESREELTGISVREVMHSGAQPIPADSDIEAVKARLADEKSNSWPVGSRDYIQGMVTNFQIDAAASKASTVRELLGTKSDFPFVHPDQPLSHALERMGHTGVDVLPVVSRANIRQMIGVVLLSDVLNSYGVAEARAGQT